MSIPQRKTGVEKDGLKLACENVSYPEWNTISPMPSCLIKPWEQIIVMAHLMLLALIVKVCICCICKRISSMIITITTALGFIHEYKSEQSIEALKKMTY